MLTEIQQKTEAWYEKKLHTIGGSEIYALVLHYCKNIKEYLPNFMPETSYQSPKKLALKFLYGQVLPIKEIHSVYGNAMEKPLINLLNKQFRGVAKFSGTQNFHLYKQSENASCSPDGYIELNGTVVDFATNESITSQDGKGMLELKTADYKFAFESEPKMQYLFQLQWNMLIAGLEWGCLSVMFPKSHELDSEFYKGQRTVFAESNMIEKIQEQTEIKTFFYKKNKSMQYLCLIAFNQFCKDYKLAKEQGHTVFEFSKDLQLFKDEKTILSDINQEKYGIREATAEEDALFETRNILKTEINDKTKKLNEVEGLLINALDENLKLQGTNFRVQYIKGNQIRFY